MHTQSGHWPSQIGRCESPTSARSPERDDVQVRELTGHRTTSKHFAANAGASARYQTSASMMTPSTPFTPLTPFAAFVLPVAPVAAPAPVIDAAATQRLLAELAPRIVRVVRAVLGGTHSELEDVQQQALLAFVQAVPSFRGECEVRHFASRIAARTALLAARRTRAARARRDDGVEVDDLGSGDAPQHDATMQRRRQDLLRDLLTRLPPEQAETLTLRVVLGWSLPEIASATNAPLTTVRSRIRLAKNALRSAIEHNPALADDLGRPDAE